MGWMRFGVLMPFVVVTAGLAVSSVVTAVSLFRQQSAVSFLLRDHVEGQRILIELQECLRDLIALEQNRVEDVAVLHDRVQKLLTQISSMPESPSERNLLETMQAAFRDYLQKWDTLPPRGSPEHDPAVRETARSLGETVLTPCEEFEDAYLRRIDWAVQQHERSLRTHAWGLALVGGLGSVAGGVLGFGLAWNHRRTLHNLRVQVRDAAGKLLPGEPEIILSSTSDMQTLHRELGTLSQRIVQTVHKLQQRENEILRAKQLAAVGQLAAGVGHEIRNPLTAIKLLVQTGIEDGGLTGEDLKVIEGEIRRMESSLKTFLDFTRPPQSEKRHLAVGPILENVVDLLRGRAGKQDVSITTRMADVVIVGNGEQLRQVFVNLGLNALDAMPTGGALTVNLQVTDREAIVEIADTGPGIDPRIAPQLFEPFASSKETGLGLGLVICKRIVEEHGGTISVNRTTDQKTIFQIRLPRKAD